MIYALTWYVFIECRIYIYININIHLEVIYKHKKTTEACDVIIILHVVIIYNRIDIVLSMT